MFIGEEVKRELKANAERSNYAYDSSKSRADVDDDEFEDDFGRGLRDILDPTAN